MSKFYALRKKIMLCEKLSTPKELHVVGICAGKKERISNLNFS